MAGLDTDERPVAQPTPEDIEQGIGADPGVQAGIDQAENYAYDPANVTGKSSGKTSASDSAKLAAAAATGGVAGLAKAAGLFVSNNRRGFAIGGGIGGFILVLIFGFLALLPYRLESLMNGFMDREFAHVQYYVERRAEKIVIRFAVRESLGSGSSVVATGTSGLNPLLDLYKTWRTRGFEADLAEKYGIKLSKSPVKGKVLRIEMPTGSTDVSDEAELTKFLDLNHSESKLFLNKSVKSETHWYQVLKRRHLRRWMAKAYGIKTWKVYSQKNGQEAKTEVDDIFKTNATDAYTTSLDDGLACLFDDPSCQDGKNQKSQGEPPEDANAPAATAEIKAAAEEAATKSTASEFFSTFTKLVSEKGLGKAVPILGWVSLGAEMDKLVYADTTVNVINNMRKLQYANVAAEWLKAKDQIKDGKTVTGAEVNATMKKLEGAETGYGFQSLYGTDKTTGTRIDPKALFGQQWLENMASFYKTATTWTGYHYVMVAYLHSVGAVFNLIADALGNLAGTLLSKIPGITNVEQFVSNLIAPLFAWIFQPVVTGLETGAELVNQIAVGTYVLAFDFTQSIGGHALSTADVIEQNQLIAQRNATEAKYTSIYDRLASLDNSGSLASQAVASLPSNPIKAFEGVVNSSLASIRLPGLSELSSLFKLTGLGSAQADTNETYGLGTNGFTESDLSQPLNLPTSDVAGPPDASGNPTGPDGKIDQYDCPETTDGQANLCLLDMTTVQALSSKYTSADDGGLGDSVTAATPPTSDPGTQSPGCSTPAPGAVANAVEPAQNYNRVTFRGVTVNQMTQTQLLLAETYAKQLGLNATFQLAQGSYRPRTSYSGTTHMGGGAVDVRVQPLGSTANILTAVKALRMAGFAAWYRLASDGFPSDHIHAELIGDKDSSAGAKSQVKDYFLGLSGLTNQTLLHDQSVGRPYPNWAAAYCDGNY